MSGKQLHITHQAAYLRGAAQGGRDAEAGRDYRPQDGATGTEDEKRAWRLGYADGWAGHYRDRDTAQFQAHRTES
jgi:hypothetical protein